MTLVVVWVVCAWRRGVDVDRRRACPHSRDVGPGTQPDANGVATRLGTMVLRGCVCVCVWQSRLSDPTMVTPEDRGGLGG